MRTVSQTRSVTGRRTGSRSIVVPLLLVGAALMGLSWPLFLSSGDVGSPYYTYVVRIETDSFTLAWGRTEAETNSIGFDSTSSAAARVEIQGGSTLVERKRNWVKVTGLSPDREYSYQVSLEGHGRIGTGSVRTYPETSDRLAFFVIGDFGTGKDEQYELAEVMYEVYRERRASSPDNPVRFVITTGDNIYGDKRFGFIGGSLRRRTGNKDSHWEAKFFRPYRNLISHIPFRPSPGNHDGREEEKSGDLPVYWDNFFIKEQPSDPGYYSFRFADLAEFYSIDSTENEKVDDERIYASGGKQDEWLQDALEHAQADLVSWKIPYLHHPIFTAGPKHDSSLERLGHFVSHFQTHGVKVVFSGHEHNFQISEPEVTGGITYIVSGAGGKVRKETPQERQRMMEDRNIAAWASEIHFLLVEIEADEMKITPYGLDGRPLDLNGPETMIVIVR